MQSTANALRKVVSAAGMITAVALGGIGLSPAFGQELPSAKPPVLVTSLGQSLDGFQIQLTVKRAGIPVNYVAIADVDKLADAQTLFLAVGASLKGFGEAGIKIGDEKERAKRLLGEAEKRGMPVVVLHMGGAERRDGLTNQLIELTTPQADAIFIRNDSDADGLFARIAAAESIPLVTVGNIVELVPHLEKLFGGAAGAPAAAGAAPATTAN